MLGFATKPKRYDENDGARIAASVSFKWVDGDAIYAVGDTEQQPHQADKGYTLKVGSVRAFQSLEGAAIGCRHSRGHRPDMARVRVEPAAFDRGRDLRAGAA